MKEYTIEEIKKHKRKARGRPKHRKLRGRMNKNERSYADEILEPLRKSGEIVSWSYESATFVVAEAEIDGKPNNCRYTPDFLVQMPDGEIYFVECKAKWSNRQIGETQDRVRMKAFVSRYPFALVLAWKESGRWKHEEWL